MVKNCPEIFVRYITLMLFTFEFSEFSSLVFKMHHDFVFVYDSVKPNGRCHKWLLECNRTWRHLYQGIFKEGKMVSTCFYGSVYILVYNIDIFTVKDTCTCTYKLFLWTPIIFNALVTWILNNTRRQSEIMKRSLKLTSQEVKISQSCHSSSILYPALPNTGRSTLLHTY